MARGVDDVGDGGGEESDDDDGGQCKCLCELVGDIDLVDDLDTDLADDNSLMEDTSELGEDLDDIPDVLDHEGNDDR